MADYKVPAGAISAAKRALAWISDGKAGKGFTSVGRGRASQLARGGTVSISLARFFTCLLRKAYGR